MNIAHSRLHKAYHYFRKIAIALRKNISNAQEISVLSLNGGRAVGNKWAVRQKAAAEVCGGKNQQGFSNSIRQCWARRTAVFSMPKRALLMQMS